MLLCLLTSRSPAAGNRPVGLQLGPCPCALATDDALTSTRGSTSAGAPQLCTWPSSRKTITSASRRNLKRQSGLKLYLDAPSHAARLYLVCCMLRVCTWCAACPYLVFCMLHVRTWCAVYLVCCMSVLGVLHAACPYLV